MMHPAEASSAGSAVSRVAEKCPCCPNSTAAYTPQLLVPTTASAVFAGLARHPAVAPQTEASYRVSSDRSRQKRGPPALLS